MKLKKDNLSPDAQEENKGNAEAQRRLSYMRNILLGIIILVSGILTKFFPDTVISVVYLVCGVVFLLIGLSDAISALKYKETGSDWQSITIAGTLSLLASIWFILAFAKSYSVALAIVIASVWFITRGILSFVGLFRGKIKRREVIVPSVLKILCGILALIFRDGIILYTKAYIGYVLLAGGALLTFFGFFMRADAREKKEKELRAEEISHGYSNALDAQTPEAIDAPEAALPSEPVPEPTPMAEVKAEPIPEVKAEPIPEVKPEPIPEPTPSAEVKPDDAPEAPEPDFGMATAALEADMAKLEKAPTDAAAAPAAAEAPKFDEEALAAEKKKKSKFGSWFS